MLIIPFHRPRSWRLQDQIKTIKRLARGQYEETIFHKFLSGFTKRHNKETMMLTINTFKKFCLKAGTKKADEIYDYYIKLEELLLETMNEESHLLRLQLDSNKSLLKNAENALEVERKKDKAAKYFNDLGF